MRAGKVLHVMHAEKFIEPFIEFVKENFDDFESRHSFFVWGDIRNFRIKSRFNVKNSNKRNIDRLKYFLSMVLALQKAEKVILHGLFVQWHLILLFFMPWNLKKCHWVIWGGDLYTYKLSKRSLKWWINELFRRFVIKRIGHFITQIEGDYRLAQQWYGAKGEWHECFMYPSNLFQAIPQQFLPHSGINILVGNSADPTNNHAEVLNGLMDLKNENIRIYCPLSYGNQKYADRIEALGKSIYEEKFVAMREFLQFEEYSKFIANIDIAIFNHKRQQGVGNIISLLGMGKKVYIRSDVTTANYFRDIGVHVGYIDELAIELTALSPMVSVQNISKIEKYFSKDVLVRSLKKIIQ